MHVQVHTCNYHCYMCTCTSTCTCNYHCYMLYLVHAFCLGHWTHVCHKLSAISNPSPKILPLNECLIINSDSCWLSPHMVALRSTSVPSGKGELLLGHHQTPTCREGATSGWSVWAGRRDEEGQWTNKAALISVPMPGIMNARCICIPRMLHKQPCVSTFWQLPSWQSSHWLILNWDHSFMPPGVLYVPRLALDNSSTDQLSQARHAAVVCFSWDSIRSSSQGLLANSSHHRQPTCIASNLPRMECW